MCSIEAPLPKYMTFSLPFELLELFTCFIILLYPHMACDEDLSLAVLQGVGPSQGLGRLLLLHTPGVAALWYSSAG